MAKTYRASFIAIGTELLTEGRSDLNGKYAMYKLPEIGFKMDSFIIVGDDIDLAVESVKAALSRSDIVICSGGLGSTGDDITRNAIAKLLGRNIVECKQWVRRQEKLFSERGAQFNDISRRQVLIVEGGDYMQNMKGIACGEILEIENHLLFLLPGVPSEFKDMFDNSVIPLLKKKFQVTGYNLSLHLTVSGMREVDVESYLEKYYKKKNLHFGILPETGLIRLYFDISEESEAEAIRVRDEIITELKDNLKQHLISENGENPEVVLGRKLKELGLTVSTAESCTGGALGGRIVSVPNASEYFLGGVIAYSNDAKKKFLHISEVTLAANGAVSEETAREMALNVRTIFSSDCAIAVTGIAGPTGATKSKNVGTTCMAWITPGDEGVKTFHFPWDRAGNIEGTVQLALYILIKGLNV